jgi:cyclopropane fatty-acyl-phospholipid synthase-like methyltransferase
MANEHNRMWLHSAEYFGDTRDHWWNRDYLELMAKRWGLAQVRSVLDLGCGLGRWGRTLAPLLAGAQVVGVEREPEWVKKATDWARACGPAERFRYEVGPVARPICRVGAGSRSKKCN